MLPRTARRLSISTKRLHRLAPSSVPVSGSSQPTRSALGSGRIAQHNASNRSRASYTAQGPSRSYATLIDRKPLFDKILIANRGEIACRVIRTARKLGIRTVAVYSDADANALHVRLADEAVNIGPAQSSESYLRADKIIAAAKKTGAQAIHPGYGFLSENAAFAEALADAGLVFIGPPTSAIRSMGSKSESKDIMTAAGVPCVPGYHGTEQDGAFLLARAEEIGFPVLIKAVLGGGGKGMRIASDAASFPDALESARREASKAFGDERVLVERYVRAPRHVEVQVMADGRNAVSLWERDCSVQRRHQKIIEEAPVPGVAMDVRRRMGETAVRAAQAVGYVGAGTVEFIFDNESKEFFFMEMNTRLQVEHPVTEMITGLDLVEMQLEVASGNPLPITQDAVPCIGHAFEARVYAENPRNNFLPDAGTLVHHVPPRTDESIRVDSGVERGAHIGVFYDPLIAKLIAHGTDRTDALRRLRAALAQYEIVGPATNVEFLSALAKHEAFVRGELDTGFIERYRDELFPPLSAPPAELLAQAALFIVLADFTSQPRTSSGTSPWDTLTARRFGGDVYARSVTLIPEGSDSAPLDVSVQANRDSSYDVSVGETTFAGVRATLTDSTHLDAAGLGRATVVPHAGRLHVFSAGGEQRAVLRVPVPLWERAATDAGVGGGSIRSPMPGVVVDVRVTPGARVERGQTLVVLESMKTEIPLRADAAGVVKAVACGKGDMVPEGRELVLLEVDSESA
ncbi:hypothetical protein AURDEDRAFT_153044 [Auricularia subglabra TFB-10046 SS5]|nr:hypothetical protein AURDEDRAFT_153044 [Auricularia subglabra TFB-10046 SS5]